MQILFHKIWICQHASHRKRPRSKRNDECGSFIDVLIKKVNRNTVRNDPYLKLENPLPCVIKINLEHSHSTENADAIKKLDVLPEIIKEFHEYFKSGLAPSEARRLHEDKLEMQHDATYSRISAYNPTDNQLYYIYNKWRMENFGPLHSPFNALKEKMIQYENEGAIVKLKDDELWVILVITPVMKRAQQLISCSEIIFLDSTSDCESSGSTFTVVVTATKAGGIPIAIMIHPLQTTESYTSAFTLLKRTTPFCFGGKEAPGVFMTDDSKAEKHALGIIWPSARQLLCHFHVAQAEWSWIMSRSSDVPESKRQNVMKLFQAM